MPIMLSKTYAAFVAAGTPDAEAREAAEEIADFEHRLTGIESPPAEHRRRHQAIEVDAWRCPGLCRHPARKVVDRLNPCVCAACLLADRRRPYIFGTISPLIPRSTALR